MPTLAEVAAAIGASLEGDPARAVRAAAPLDRAGEHDLAFLANPKYAALLATTKAAAVIVGEGVPAGGRAVLRAKDPYLAFARAVAFLHPPAPPPFPGVHPTAVVGAGARVAPSAQLGPYVVVAPGASNGERCVLDA